MNPGIIIEGITKEELFSQFKALTERINQLEEIVNVNVRTEFTLSELSRIKGYGKAQIKRMIVAKHIPFNYEGKELVISREDAGRFKSKPK